MADIDTLAMDVRPEWDEIEDVRSRCRDFLENLHYDVDVLDAISMVSSELVENAVKYGTFPQTPGIIEYRLKVNKTDITIEVKHPVDDTAGKHLNRLDEIVQWIRGYQNPFEVYVKKLKEVSTKSFADDESCLGLVRIAYEGQSILDFYLDRDNTLSVSAIFLK